MDDFSTDLVNKVCVALAQWGVSAGLDVSAQGWDCLSIEAGNQAVDYVWIPLPEITRAGLGGALMLGREASRRSGLPSVLLTEQVSPPVAEDLRLHGQAFADVAGNAWLPHPLILVCGRKAASRPRLPLPGRSDTPVGLTLTFALLCEPGLAASTQRDIAAAAGVSLGSVPLVLDDLERLGFLEGKHSGRRLRTSRVLLDHWAQGYARRLRPRTWAACYTTPLFDSWAYWQLPREMGLWGGEAAAHLLTAWMEPGVLTVYADELPDSFLTQNSLELSEGPLGIEVPHLEWRKPFWAPVLDELFPDMVSPILVYADLLATGDATCMEAAEQVYAAELAHVFA